MVIYFFQYPIKAAVPAQRALPATPIPAAPIDCAMDTAPIPTPDVAAADMADAAVLPEMYNMAALDVNVYKI